MALRDSLAWRLGKGFNNALFFCAFRFSETAQRISQARRAYHC